VRSDLVVIAGISLQNPAQVSLAQDDDMVDALAPDRSDQSSIAAIASMSNGAMAVLPDSTTNVNIDLIGGVILDAAGNLSLPKIISGRSDGAIRIELAL
jgi:hypothetical protein